MMCPHFDGDEIPHAPRGNKQRRLFPKNLRRAFFQPIDRRVFSVNVVADFCLRHGASHLRSGPRHRVAAQVHHSFRNLPRLRHLIWIHSLIPLRHGVTHVFSLLCDLCVLQRPLCKIPSDSLILYLINCTKTSFETLSFSGASRTTLPSRSTNPAEVMRSNRPPSVTPYSRSILARSIPSNCRNPRNNSSSSALSAVSFSCCSTGNRPLCTAAT